MADLRSFVLLLTAAISGCTPAPEAEVCTADCRLQIHLPEDRSLPPGVPARIHVAGGQILNLDVHGRRPGQARTVITFEQAAFEDENGTPLYSLELVTGANHYRLRGFEAGVCHAPDGCRYFVVNSGMRERPAASGAPGWLIIEPGEAKPGS